MNAPLSSVRADGGVLRDVVVLEQPHTLRRPGQAAVVVPVVNGEASPVQAQPRPAAAEPTTQQIYEQGLRAGYEQGAAAAQAQQRERDEAQLRRAVDEARRRAAEDGRAEGLQRAQQEAEAAVAQFRAQVVSEAEAMLQERVQRLEQLAAGIAAQSARAAAQAQDDLVALAFEAACRVLGERAIQPAVLRGMVQALAAQRAGEPLAVHVHPDDHAWLQRQATTAAPDAWSWVADARVELGGVLLKWPHGTLDARLDTQLQSLKEMLLRVRAECVAADSTPAAAQAELKQ